MYKTWLVVAAAAAQPSQAWNTGFGSLLLLLLHHSKAAVHDTANARCAEELGIGLDASCWKSLGQGRALLQRGWTPVLGSETSAEVVSPTELPMLAPGLLQNTAHAWKAQEGIDEVGTKELANEIQQLEREQASLIQASSLAHAQHENAQAARAWERQARQQYQPQGRLPDEAWEARAWMLPLDKREIHENSWFGPTEGSEHPGEHGNLYGMGAIPVKKSSTTTLVSSQDMFGEETTSDHQDGKVDDFEDGFLEMQHILEEAYRKLKNLLDSDWWIMSTVFFLFTVMIWWILVIVEARFYLDIKLHPPPSDQSLQVQHGLWYYGLCMWYQVPGLSLFTCCCPAIRWADTMRMAGFIGFWLALPMYLALQAGCFYPVASFLFVPFLIGMCVFYRQRIRKKFEMPYCTPITILADILFHTFCGCCALVQEARQLEYAWASQDPVLKTRSEKGKNGTS